MSFSSLERSQDITTKLGRSHTSYLINIEKALNRPITKFYNGNDVNMITADLGLTKTRTMFLTTTAPCS